MKEDITFGGMGDEQGDGVEVEHGDGVCFCRSYMYPRSDRNRSFQHTAYHALNPVALAEVGQFESV
jgi:hypothetical protein